MIRVTAVGLNQLARANVPMPETSRQLEILAEKAVSQWEKEVRGFQQKHAQYFAHQYARNIEILSSGRMNYEIGVNDKGQRGAEVMEQGRERYDMKPALVRSPRARISKKGDRYTIIGFRHGMKQVRSRPDISEQFDSIKSYTKVGEKRRRNADGNMVSRNVYNYSSDGVGTRVNDDSAPEKPHHKTPKFEGMVKTRQEVGKKRPSGKYHHQAVTFRIVKLSSKGWFFPAIKAEKPMQKFVDSYKPQAEKELVSAVRSDLINLIKK